MNIPNAISREAAKLSEKLGSFAYVYSIDVGDRYAIRVTADTAWTYSEEFYAFDGRIEEVWNCGMCDSAF